MFYLTCIYKSKIVHKKMNVDEFLKKDLEKGDLVEIILNSDAQKEIVKGQEIYIPGGKMKNPGRIHARYIVGIHVEKEYVNFSPDWDESIAKFCEKEKVEMNGTHYSLGAIQSIIKY